MARIPGAWLAAVSLGVAAAARGAPLADVRLDFEMDGVLPERTSVRIPADTGTRLSLSDDLHADLAATWRTRVTLPLTPRHSISLLAAPLRIEADGILREALRFDHAVFPRDTFLKATYRFDSFRFVYRYQLCNGRRFRLSAGTTGKIRDAAVEVQGGGLSAEDADVAFVPLLGFHAELGPVGRWTAVADGDATAIARDHVEDILIGAHYDLRRRFALKMGYRLVEGGMDTGEIYASALLHCAVLGLVYQPR